MVDGTVDIIVANPPYSVKGFKSVIPQAALLDETGKKNYFSTLEYANDRCDDIECVFLERTTKMLSVGGVAAIIVPASLLTNSGSIFVKAREILLKSARIVAIVYLNDSTFAATDVRTAVLFLERRDDAVVDHISATASSILSSSADAALNGIPSIVAAYESQTGSALDNKATPPAKKKREVVEKNDRLAIYALSAGQKVLVVEAPLNKELNRDFLGYSFSDRRGSEGMHLNSLGGVLLGRNDQPGLFELIHNAFDGNYSSDSARYARVMNFIDLVDLSSDLSIRLPSAASVKLKELAILKGTRTLGSLVEVRKGKFRSSDMRQTGVYDFFTSRAKNPSGKSDQYCFDSSDKYLLFIPDGGSGKGVYGVHIGLGKNWLVSGRAAATDHVWGIFLKPEAHDLLSIEYLHFALNALQKDFIDMCDFSHSLGNLGLENFLRYPIRVPDKNEQRRYIDECLEQNKKIASLEAAIAEVK